MGFRLVGEKKKSISICLLKQLINGFKSHKFLLVIKIRCTLFYLKKKTDDKFHCIYSHSIKAEVNSYANFPTLLLHIKHGGKYKIKRNQKMNNYLFCVRMCQSCDTNLNPYRIFMRVSFILNDFFFTFVNGQKREI